MFYSLAVPGTSGALAAHLRRRRLRFAGAERLRAFRRILLDLNERVRAAEHAPRGRPNLLERRHASREIVERGGGVHCRAPARNSTSS